MSIEIKKKETCEACSGSGYSIRRPAPITANSSLLESIKNNKLTAEQIQEIISKPPEDVKGVTDVEIHLICNHCGGSGQIEKNLTIEELKELLK